MFDSDDEDLFAHYEYNDTDLADLAEGLMETMNNDHEMGDIKFGLSSLSVKTAPADQVRVECELDNGASFSFSIPSYVVNEPLEDRIYDTIVAMGR